jgi:RNA polymerase sigma-70 factor (ECF subfamily)
MSAQDRSARPLESVPASGEERRHTDAEMVLALRRGEPWAAEAIWDRHSANVRRFLLRALGRASDGAEDLTQEVFLRIFTRAQRIREPAALREFVMSVAVRVLKWELRRRWVRRRVLLSEDGHLPEVSTQGADQEARQALERCYAILDRLGSRERTAFVLRYLEEMTMEEVAAGLGSSVSTAKRLVSRAVASLSLQVGKDVDLRGYFSDRRSSVFHGVSEGS